ncbi:MAG: PepSY domain-containing protein [Gemmatimonadetes bacterium]|nr:PepSY domain-containing protein [Gemmatimonadota bacterium]
MTDASAERRERVERARAAANRGGGARRAYGRRAFHSVVLWLHRWVGIVAALFLLVVAGTGAALVYADTFDRWLNPQLLVVRPGDAGAQPLPLDSLVAIATRATIVRTPNTQPASVIIMPQRADEAARVQFGFRHVFLDPVRGTVLGERGIGEAVMAQVRILHHSLLVGRFGRLFTVGASWAAVLLALGGLWLWWPRRIWRVTRTRSWRGINYDLHNITGLLGSVGTLLFAGSAVAMSLTDPLDRVYRATLGDAPNVVLAPPSARAVQPLPLDTLVARGVGQVPGALREVHLPKEPWGTVVLFKQTPGEYGQRARNRVWVDANDGRIRGTLDQQQRPLGTRVAMRMEDWHVAAFTPTWSRWFGVLSCLLLAFGSVSGPLIWLKPRRRD